MVKEKKIRQPCKKGRAWIDRQLAKEGSEGDAGAKARWAAAWFARQDR